MVTVTIDTREQAPLRFSDAVQTERATLTAGDYSARDVTDLVALERKRTDELAVCCGSDRERFLAQIERLRAYPVRGLVIEGDLPTLAGGRYRSKIKPASVVGTLVAICTDMLVPVWFASDAEHAAIIVEKILRRVHERQHEIRRDLPALSTFEPMAGRLTRGQVIRALQGLRAEHESKVGALLAALERDAGKRAEHAGEPIEGEAQE